jgi:hypothetical protein
MLKMQLKIHRGTLAVWEERLQMSDGLKQWLGVRALWRLLLATKPNPEPVQTAPQFPAQLVNGLQGERQAGFFRRGFERESPQQWEQPLPQPAGSDRVPGQNVGNENAKAAAAATALATAGAPDPLAPQAAAIGGERIVAVEFAMAI